MHWKIFSWFKITQVYNYNLERFLPGLYRTRQIDLKILETFLDYELSSCLDFLVFNSWSFTFIVHFRFQHFLAFRNSDFSLIIFSDQSLFHFFSKVHLFSKQFKTIRRKNLIWFSQPFARSWLLFNFLHLENVEWYVLTT